MSRGKGNGVWEGLGRGKGIGSLCHPPAGSQNVLAHFGLLKGHGEGKTLKEIWGMWTVGTTLQKAKGWVLQGQSQKARGMGPRGPGRGSVLSENAVL